jgi:hypothetical protein
MNTMSGQAILTAMLPEHMLLVGIVFLIIAARLPGSAP